MDTNLKTSTQFDSEKSTIVCESELEIINEPKKSSLRLALVFIGLALGFFLAALDQTIIITALGKISAEFNATGDIGLLGSAYHLAMVGFLPMYGIFADIIGHKKVYLIAITIFLVGSIICGMSSSMAMLIVSRAVQGIGGAGLNTIALIIVTDVVSVRDRGKYQSVLAVAIGTATMAGPFIGGILADAGLWRWSFFMNIFIGIAAMVIIIIFLQEDLYISHEQSDLPIAKQLRQVDYGSVLLLMPGTICILVALQMGGEMFPWNSTLVVALFSIGGLTFVLFVLCEIFVIKHNPLMPRRMMTDRTTVAIFVSQFFSSASDFGILYFVPLHYQIVRGDSAIQSAMELFPFFVALVVGGVVSGILITVTGRYRIYLWSGGCLCVIGSALFSTSAVDTNIIHQYVYLGLIGFGFGLSKQSFVVAGQAAVPKKDISLATSHGQFFHAFGGAVGTSISAAIFQYNMSVGLKDLMDKFHVKLSFKNLNMVKYLPSTIKNPVRTVAVQSLNKIYLFCKKLG